MVFICSSPRKISQSSKVELHDKIRGFQLRIGFLVGTPGDTQIEGFSAESASQTILPIASVPQSKKAWRPLDNGELLMVRHGEIIEH